MLAIADFANDKGSAWPAIDTIAAKSRHTDRGVQKILARLQDKGLLLISRGAGPYDTNVYQIIPESRGEPGSPSPERGEPPGSPNPSVTVNTSVPKASTVRREGGTGGIVHPRTAFTPPTIEEVKEFCPTVGIPDTDADWFFYKGQGNGWTNGGKPMKDWKATLRSWKAGGYLPSQKNGNNGNGHVNGNGHTSTTSQRIGLERERERLQTELQSLTVQYDWDDTAEKRQRRREIKQRVMQIDGKLGELALA